MTASQVRRRKGRPYNPALAEYQAKVKADEEAKRRDRKSRDLLRNARVVPIEIDDPTPDGGKIIVMRSTRDDPLSEMLARGQISECDFAAGRHWQRAYEESEIGAVRGIDPTREAVDGGRLIDPISERRDEAGRELKRARDALKESNWLIVVVLGTRKSLLEVARETAVGSHEGVYKRLRFEFHGALQILGVLFGYSMGTKTTVRMKQSSVSDQRSKVS